VGGYTNDISMNGILLGVQGKRITKRKNFPKGYGGRGGGNILSLTPILFPEDHGSNQETTSNIPVLLENELSPLLERIDSKRYISIKSCLFSLSTPRQLLFLICHYE